MTTIQILIALIPVLPLLAFVANGLFGRKLGHAGGWLAVFCMGGSALIGAYIFIASLSGSLALPIQVNLWEWMAVGDFSLRIGFRVDQLTALMLCFVTFVSTLVFLYSIGYMHDDPGFNRFFAYLGLFDFSMLVLVLGDSLPVLFVGWEGVGLCSYLLIGFWYALKGAPEAGMKAFVVNRIGDFGFLVAMFMLYKAFGTLNVQEIVEGAVAAAHGQSAGVMFLLSKNIWGLTYITWATLAMFLGCTGKSAQIPLFVWLPDAMAGPTPVSALIHAATMVTAGVYLMVRMSALFAMAPLTMGVVAVIGAATAFVAGSIALTQRDIKKVLAYSTVSQLGYMFLACGVGAFSAGIFHVFTHAFFKGCLFLGAGSVIHACHHEQDLHKMGGLKQWLPKTRWTYLLACFALAGMFPFAGFFSKDEILWQTFAHGKLLLWIVGIVTALMTAFYAFRSYFMAFEGKCRLDHHTQEHVHESPWTMTLPLILLAFGSVFAGFMNLPPLFLGGHEGVVSKFLEPVTEASHEILAAHAGAAAEFGAGIEGGLMFFSVCIAALGIFLAYLLALKLYPDGTWRLSTKLGIRGLYNFSLARWHWDDAYNVIFGGGLTVVAFISVLFDRWVIDLFLHTIGAIARLGSYAARTLQNGQVQVYALMILVGANVMIWFVYFF